MAKKRSARLRKKLHIGEFQEFGFTFESETIQGLSSESSERLADAFLEEVIESRGLLLGGWITGGFISMDGKGSTSEADISAVRAWLESRPELKNVAVSDLIDAWSSPAIAGH